MIHKKIPTYILYWPFYAASLKQPIYLQSSLKASLHELMTIQNFITLIH